MFSRYLILGCLVLGGVSAGAAPHRMPALSPEPTGLRLPGKLIWADILTTEPNTTARFYGSLLDLMPRTFTDEGGKYVMLSNEAGPVVGVARGPDRKDKRAAARWLPYFSTTDVDGAASAVEAGGGRVLAGPAALPERGWQVLGVDSTGAVFGLMTSAAGDPADGPVAPGGLGWFHLFTREPAAAAAFYDEVLAGTVDERGGAAYVWSAGGEPQASISAMPAETTAGDTWVPYFRVSDLARKTTIARRLGAKIVVPSTRLAGGMTVVVFADPMGGVFALVTKAEETEAN